MAKCCMYEENKYEYFLKDWDEELAEITGISVKLAQERWNEGLMYACICEECGRFHFTD